MSCSVVVWIHIVNCVVVSCWCVVALLHMSKLVRRVLTLNPSTHVVSFGWSFIWLELKRLDVESCRCLNRTGSFNFHERIKAMAILAIYVKMGSLSDHCVCLHHELFGILLMPCFVFNDLYLTCFFGCKYSISTDTDTHTHQCFLYIHVQVE